VEIYLFIYMRNQTLERLDFTFSLLTVREGDHFATVHEINRNERKIAIIKLPIGTHYPIAFT
jgi:hypothetical protein